MGMWLDIVRNPIQIEVIFARFHLFIVLNKLFFFFNLDVKRRKMDSSLSKVSIGVR